MFMANEPLKLDHGSRGWGSGHVAEMFMANEPLKRAAGRHSSRSESALQRCLWRMSH